MNQRERQSRIADFWPPALGETTSFFLYFFQEPETSLTACTLEQVFTLQPPVNSPPLPLIKRATTSQALLAQKQHRASAEAMGGTAAPAPSPAVPSSTPTPMTTPVPTPFGSASALQQGGQRRAQRTDSAASFASEEQQSDMMQVEGEVIVEEKEGGGGAPTGESAASPYAIDMSPPVRAKRQRGRLSFEEEVPVAEAAAMREEGEGGGEEEEQIGVVEEDLEDDGEVHEESAAEARTLLSRVRCDLDKEAP